MKKLYIRFEEGNKESLKLACDETEKLGYVKDSSGVALRFEGRGILSLRSNGTYLTGFRSVESYIGDGYSEHILPLGFKRGEKVCVRDDESQAWEEKIFLTEIEGADKPFVCVHSYDEDEFNEGEKFNILEYKFCKPLIKAKKKMTIAEIENLLGYEILVSKD